MIEAIGRRRLVYLVRHGEADWNAEGRLCTRSDRPLTSHGRLQAADLGRKLASVPFDSVVTSPLVRAAETASILVAANEATVGPTATIDPRLVEVDFGPFEGWTEDDLAADPRGRAWRAGEIHHVDGMETDESAIERARAAFADLSATGYERTLVVSHGYLIRTMLVACVLGLGPAAIRILRVRNCRPAVVEFRRQPLLLGLNLDGPEPLDEPRPA